MGRSARVLWSLRLRACSRFVEAWILPRRCPGCGGLAPGPGRLCAPCRDELDPVRPGRRCAACTGPLPCRGCKVFRGPLARLDAAYHYRGTGGRLVRRVKLDHDWGALGFLGRAMARRLVRADRAYRRFVVVPVPLAPGRLRDRGFNQAAELGRWVARRLDLPLLPRGLARRRETEPQGSALVRSRPRNVAGAFDLGRQAGRLQGRPVLLVDDVGTSGATLRECARVLKQGARVPRVEARLACTARQA